jgi:hypothetical protein
MAVGISRTRKCFDTSRMGPDVAQGRKQDLGLSDIAVPQDDQTLGREPLGAQAVPFDFHQRHGLQPGVQRLQHFFALTGHFLTLRCYA